MLEGGTAAMLAVALLLGGCSRGDVASEGADREPVAAPTAASTPASEAAASATPQSSQLRYSLGIVGYNYTDLAIEDYSVNGQSAFNLGVSNEDSGGGKTACCFGWAPATKLPKPIKIQWTRDMKRWCRQTVMLSEPGPPEPTTFEVHFYPDGHIEVAITDNYSAPRLKLAAIGRVRRSTSANANNDEKMSECRDGEFPISEVSERKGKM